MSCQLVEDRCDERARLVLLELQEIWILEDGRQRTDRAETLNRKTRAVDRLEGKAVLPVIRFVLVRRRLPGVDQCDDRRLVRLGSPVRLERSDAAEDAKQKRKRARDPKDGAAQTGQTRQRAEEACFRSRGWVVGRALHRSLR